MRRRQEVLLARAWGRTPGEVRDLASRGEISAAEATEATLLELFDPVRGPGVRAWLFREQEARDARRREEEERRRRDVAALIEAAEAETDREKRREIGRRLNALQGLTARNPENAERRERGEPGGPNPSAIGGGA